MSNTRSGKTAFEPGRLTGAGCGLWKYSAAGGDEAPARDAAFFAPAFGSYGMRAGDVVIVNAGNGNVFLVGV